MELSLEVKLNETNLKVAPHYQGEYPDQLHKVAALV
jgi:hypothetical protein